ncbi:uncharacterized protein PRCAT00001580001 [Priceomyces carsonii]|uniref:uncharacterized protein n=1 Tax=Priceomyces carsonii TaxID=28549 RepID=UPI002ED87166|nr:unnamed protein product [Priceomyces carsonii]
MADMTDFIYKGEDFDDKVRKQVEFYFSDSNLQTDKFLWKIYEANDGWVELKTILTFSRMRQFRPEEKVISALKQSNKLLLSQSDDMVRRKDPLKELHELRNTRKRNSVHVEGFPKNLTQEDLEEWFSNKIAPDLPNERQICSIRRIRSRSKKEFFGVIDVEFKTQQDADHFLNAMEVEYPQGIVRANDDSVDKKNLLKKMSLLTFQEMRENGKRFGVNDVTKRRNSLNENNRSKMSRKNFGRKKHDDPKLAAEEEDDQKEQYEGNEQGEREEKEEEKEEIRKEGAGVVKEGSVDESEKEVELAKGGESSSELEDIKHDDNSKSGHK